MNNKKIAFRLLKLAKAIMATDILTNNDKADLIFNVMTGMQRIEVMYKAPGGEVHGVKGLRAIKKYIAEHLSEFKHVENSPKYKEILEGELESRKILGFRETWEPAATHEEWDEDKEKHPSNPINQKTY